MNETQFPGRWLGGLSLILGPVLMLAGALIRIGPDMFFPAQLAAYAEHPALLFAAYSAVLAGTVVLWPGVVTLARRVGVTHPRWALWGGVPVVFGLFARTFHAGADHMAFRLVDVQGAAAATSVVADSYGAYHVVSALNVAVLAGWPVLAFGAWRAGVLGTVGAVALATVAALPMGVLKGTGPVSVVALLGLTVALLPLGVRVLRDGPAPAVRTAVAWTGIVAAGLAGMVLLGLAG